MHPLFDRSLLDSSDTAVLLVEHLEDRHISIRVFRGSVGVLSLSIVEFLEPQRHK